MKMETDDGYRFDGSVEEMADLLNRLSKKKPEINIKPISVLPKKTNLKPKRKQEHINFVKIFGKPARKMIEEMRSHKVSDEKIIEDMSDKVKQSGVKQSHDEIKGRIKSLIYNISWTANQKAKEAQTAVPKA